MVLDHRLVPDNFSCDRQCSRHLAYHNKTATSHNSEPLHNVACRRRLLHRIFLVSSAVHLQKVADLLYSAS